MFSESKVTEIHCMADDFCKHLTHLIPKRILTTTSWNWKNLTDFPYFSFFTPFSISGVASTMLMAKPPLQASFTASLLFEVTTPFFI